MFKYTPILGTNICICQNIYIHFLWQIYLEIDKKKFPCQINLNIHSSKKLYLSDTGTVEASCDSTESKLQYSKGLL